MKQKHPRPSRKKVFIITGAALCVALLVLQLIFDAYVYRSSIRVGDETPITNLIISAVEGLQKPAPIDPVSGKVYLTDAKLVLPAPTDSFMQLEYANNGGTGSTAELEVTTTNILHQAEAKLWASQSSSSGWNRQPDAVFNQVPNLQACARGVQVFFQPQTTTTAPQFQLRTTKTLANGRTMYLYTETTCHIDLTGLVNYLKQAESY